MIYTKNNKILVGPNGHLANECGIEYGNDCGLCDAGKTPKYLTLTISGVQQVSGCVSYKDVRAPYREYSCTFGNIPDVNGTFLLPQTLAQPVGVNDNCMWQKDITLSPGITRNEHDRTLLCDNLVCSTTSTTLIYRVRVYNSNIYVQVYVYFSSSPYGYNSSYGFRTGYYTPTEGCAGVLNEDSRISSAVYPNFGYGGTCTVQEGDHT